MLLGFEPDNQFANRFFLTSISCVFCVLDLSIETLLNCNRGHALVSLWIRLIALAW
jgi:hypothetical protein